jgi:hypothetical protein
MLDYTTIEKIRRLNDCFRRSMAFGGSVRRRYADPPAGAF